MRALVAAVVVPALVATAAADPARVRLAFEAGTEVDSNVHRAANPDGESAREVVGAGGRGAVRAALVWTPRPRHALRLHGIAALKLFATPDEASQEDVGVLSAEARYDMGLGERPLAVSARVSVYDATERSAAADRDFTTGDGTFGLTLFAERDHRITATVGYRLFLYKPNADLDFSGEIGGLAWRHVVQKDAEDPDDAWALDLALGYLAERRRYEGEAYHNVCPAGQPLEEGCLRATGVDRSDLVHRLSAEATFTRSWILGARYELSINDSNSFGQSFLMHRFEAAATFETFSDVFLTAKLVVRINRFLDDILLDDPDLSFLTIEDESRNAIILHATRDLGGSFTLEARWSWYSEAFAAASVDYDRHTLYLGAIYAWDSGR